MKERIPKRPPKVVREWATMMHRALLKQRGARVAAPEVTRLAGVWAQLGPVAQHPDEFLGLASLFLLPERASSWHLVLSDLVGEVPVRRVAACTLAFNKLASTPMNRVRVRLENVVPVMVQVNDPVALIQDGLRGGLTHPGAIFHPNTYQAAQRRVRGSLGELADSSVQAQILNKVVSFGDG